MSQYSNQKFAEKRDIRNSKDMIMDNPVKCSVSQNHGPSMWRYEEVIRHVNKASDLRRRPGKDKRLTGKHYLKNSLLECAGVLCILKINLCFGETCFLCLYGYREEAAHFFSKCREHVPDYTASHFIGQHSSLSRVSEPRVSQKYCVDVCKGCHRWLVMHTHTHTYTHTHHTHKHICTHTHTHMHTHARAHTNTHTHAHTHTHTRTHTHTHTHTLQNFLPNSYNKFVFYI